MTGNQPVSRRRLLTAAAALLLVAPGVKSGAIGILLLAPIAWRQLRAARRILEGTPAAAAASLPA